MITPVFEINQTELFLEFLIKAPFAKISDAEISIVRNEFFFFSKPYFLRLHLPNEIIENGCESATYDSDLGAFIVKVSKKNKGEHFPGLEFVTKLLTPVEKISAVPLVEIIEPNENHDFEQEIHPDKWYVEQKIDSQEMPCCSKKENYGFASQRHGVFTKLREDLWNLIDVNDPDLLSVEDRKNLTFNEENLKFSDDHYLADFFESDQIERLISFVGPWEKNVEDVKFTEDEIFRLKNLPKRNYSLDDAALNSVAFSLVDILFAYAFDYRTTEGENNVESSWLITKISPTLSCLLNWTDAKQSATRSLRRSLCFPLYRNWKLSTKVLDDVQKILESGKRTILKCLLDIHEVFSNSGDYRYILNELYITDYCVWIQSAKDQVFTRLADDLNHLELKKSDVQLDLDEIELAGKLALIETRENKNLPDSNSPEHHSQLDSDDTSESSESADEENDEFQGKLKNLKLVEEIS